MYRIDRGHVAGAHHVRSYAHEKLARSPRAKGIGSIESQTSLSLSSFFHPRVRLIYVRFDLK